MICLHKWAYTSRNVRICRECAKRQIRRHGDGFWLAAFKLWHDA